MNTKWMIGLFLLALFFAGCAERLTKEQWLERMPPPKTAAEGKAMAILESELIAAKGKVATMASLDKVKMLCIAGIVGSVFAIALGAKPLGVAGLLASGAGFGMAYAGSEYARWVGLIGLAMGICAGAYAVIIIIRALKQIIEGNEEIIKSGGDVADTLKAAQKKVQSLTTEKIVEKVKNGNQIS